MSISAKDLETAQRASTAFRMQAVEGFLDDPHFDPEDIFGIPEPQSEIDAQKILQVHEAFFQKLYGADEKQQRLSAIKKSLKYLEMRHGILEKIHDLLEPSGKFGKIVQKLRKKSAVLAKKYDELLQEKGELESELERIEGLSSRQATYACYGGQIFSQRRGEAGMPDGQNVLTILGKKDKEHIPLAIAAYLSVPENHSFFEAVYGEWEHSKPEIDDYGQELGPKTLKPLELIFRIEREKLRDVSQVQNQPSVAALTALFVHNDIVRILNGDSNEGSIDAQANSAIAKWVTAKKVKNKPNVLRGEKGLLRKEKIGLGKFDKVFSAGSMVDVLARPTKEGDPTGLELAGILDDTLARIIKELDDPFDIEDAVLLRMANEYGVIANVLDKKMKGGVNPETVIEAVPAETGGIMSDTGVEMAKRKAKAARARKEADEKVKKAKRNKWIDRALNVVSFGLWHNSIFWKIISIGGLFSPFGRNGGHGRDGGGNGGHE